MQALPAGSDFWDGRDISKKQVCTAIATTLSGMHAKDRFHKDGGKFGESAKRALAECMETFLLHYFHSASLCCQHRKACTVNSADFRLAETLREPALLSRSLDDEGKRQELHCKRLRRQCP